MRGTVVVVPLESGPGWLTCGVSVTRIVRLPWAIATVLIRTSSPITIVPLASSMITMAGLSGRTRRFSIRPSTSIGSRAAMSSSDGARIDGLADRSNGAVDLGRDAQRRGQVGIAQAEPERIAGFVEAERDLLLHDRAVGDLARGGDAAGDRGGRASRRDGAGRDRALRDGINIAVGGEQRRHQQRAAGQVRWHRPSAETATSMRLPLWVKAGSSAVTITAARFLVSSLATWSRVLTPSRSSMPISDSRVNTALSSLSPVPAQADDQAIADQLVGPHAFDVGDVLDPDLTERGPAAPPAKTPATTRTMTTICRPQATSGLPGKNFATIGGHIRAGRSIGMKEASPVPGKTHGIPPSICRSPRGRICRPAQMAWLE